MKVVDKIVNYEWDMLLAVNPLQKKLECMNNKHTFMLMRKSQWSVYPLEIQASYLSDIHKAIAEKRNLMIEKYGYMMKETDPEKFVRIEHELPSISNNKISLVIELLKIHEKWYTETEKVLPKSCSYGRGCMNSSINTSTKSYLKGELFTLSENTLSKMLEYSRDVMKNGGNLIVEIYKNYVVE